MKFSDGLIKDLKENNQRLNNFPAIYYKDRDYINLSFLTYIESWNYVEDINGIHIEDMCNLERMIDIVEENSEYYRNHPTFILLKKEFNIMSSIYVIMNI